MDDLPSDSVVPSSGPPSGGSSGPGQGVFLKVARAVFIVIFFQVFWKLAGFILNLLISYFYGPSLQADAFYFVTENVVFLLQSLSMKVAIPVLVPLFKERLDAVGEEQAWGFLNTVINLCLILQALVMVAGMVYAPEFIALAGPGFDRETEQMATHIMRWIMPGVFLISFATVTYATLNSYNEFGFAAAGDAVQKIVWVLAFLALGLLMRGDISRGAGVEAIVFSFLVGAGANLLTHVVGLRQRLGFYRPTLSQLSWARRGMEGVLLGVFAAVFVLAGMKLRDWGTPEPVIQATCATVAGAYLLLLWWRARKIGSPMAKLAALAVPVIVGILFAKYRDLFTNFYATFTGKGVFSDLKFARKVGELPNTLIAQAVAVAILPYLCELAQRKKWDDFEQVMTRTLKIMFMVFVPLTVATVVLRQSLIEVLLDLGRWDMWHVTHAGDALGLYTLALLFFAIEQPLQQSFFSMQRMWSVTLIGAVSTTFHLLFLYLGVGAFGLDIFIMVALVYPVARIAKGLILIGWMRFLVPILPWRSTAVFLGKMTLACTGLGLVMWATHGVVKEWLDPAPYRAREVMVDTFNVEAPAWNADNVVEMEIVARPRGEGGPERSARPGDPVQEEPEGRCLYASYVFSPRRTTLIRRNVEAFHLSPGTHLSLRVRADRPVRPGLRLSGAAGTTDPQFYDPIEPGTWKEIAYEVPRADGNAGHWSYLHLWDATDGREMTPTRLWVDDLRVDGTVVDDFEPSLDGRGWACLSGALNVADLEHEMVVSQLERWGLPRAEAESLARDYPTRSRQQLIVVDWLDRRGHPDLGKSPADTLRQAIQGNRKPPSAFGPLPFVHVEYAILFRDGSAGAASFERDLSQYQLAGLPELAFKIQSEVPLRIRITLISASGSARAEIEVLKSSRRKRCTVPIRQFQTVAGQFSMDGLKSVRFEELREVPESAGRAWFDNLEFRRPAQVSRFEAVKLVHCAVPTAAGLVVFVLLLWGLRLEEAGDVVRWLREHGWERIRRRLKR